MAQDGISYSDVYNIQHYKWDGKNRPQVEDYISPWSSVATSIKSKWATQSGYERNASIEYAKANMEAALAQYKDDLSFWQERDERDYTDPLSQKNRYTEAGYNLGYIYGSVDSGNSAVGYSPSDADIESPNNENNMQGVKEATEVVTSALKLVTDMAKTGFQIKQIVEETAKISWDKVLSIKRGEALALQNQWFEILRTTSPDGEDVTNDFTKSLAFLLEKTNYKIQDKELSRITEFVSQCKEIYSNEATNISKDLMQDMNNLINDIDSQVGQAILRLLGIAVINRTK